MRNSVFNKQDEGKIRITASASDRTLLFLVRTAEADHNVASIIQGQSISNLTQKGEEQAKILSEYLWENEIKRSGRNTIKIYYSANGSRCEQTAGEIKKGLETRSDLKIELKGEGSFNEIDLGDWENKRLNEIRKEEWNERFESRIKLDDKNFKQRFKGETRTKVFKRAIPTLIELIKRNKNQNLVIVGSAAINKLMINALKCIKQSGCILGELNSDNFYGFKEIIKYKDHIRDYQYNASYNLIEIVDGEITRIKRRITPYEVNFSKEERKMKLHLCKYCEQKSRRLKVRNRKLIGRFTEVQYICEKYLCDFRRETGYKYVEERPIDLSQLPDSWLNEEIKGRIMQVLLSEPHFGETITEFIMQLNLAFKPDFTILGLRLVGRDGEIDFGEPPCISNIARDEENQVNYRELLMLKFQDRNYNYYDLLNVNRTKIVSIEPEVREFIREVDIYKSPFNKFPIGINKLRTLLLIGIDQPIEKEKTKESCKLLLELFLPYPIRLVEKYVELFEEWKLTRDFFSNHIGHIRTLRFDRRCSNCERENCPVLLVFPKSNSQDPRVSSRGDIEGKSEGIVVGEQVEKIINILECMMSRELECKRSQIWTLKYVGGKNPHYRFVLPKAKKEQLGKEFIDERRIKDIHDPVFNRYLEVLEGLKHGVEGILGDTSSSWIPEFIPSAWSDPRETELERKRKSKKSEGSKAERFFYGRYMDYSAIPVIIDRTYVGVVMFFYRHFGKLFDPDKFYWMNKNAIRLITKMKNDLETAITQDFLNMSIENLLKRREINEIRYYAARFGFLPDVEFTNEIRDSINSLDAKKVRDEYYEFSPNESDFQVGRIYDTKEFEGIIFRFRQPKEAITFSLEVACETFMYDNIIASRHRELMLNQKRLIGLLRDFHHIMLKYIIDSMQYALESGDREVGGNISKYINVRGEYIDRLATLMTDTNGKLESGCSNKNVSQIIFNLQNIGFLIGRLRADTWNIFNENDWSKQLIQWKNYFNIHINNDFKIKCYNGELETVFENAIDNSFKYGLLNSYNVELNEIEEQKKHHTGVDRFRFSEKQYEINEKRRQLCRKFKIFITVDKLEKEGVITIYDNGYGSDVDENHIEIWKDQLSDDYKGFGFWIMNCVMKRLDGRFDLDLMPSNYKQGYNNIKLNFYFPI